MASHSTSTGCARPRDALSRAEARGGGFDNYERRTLRDISVFVLEPR
jgi:hypothetical protein